MSKFFDDYMKTMNTLTDTAHKQRVKETEKFKGNVDKWLHKKPLQQKKHKHKAKKYKAPKGYKRSKPSFKQVKK